MNLNGHMDCIGAPFFVSHGALDIMGHIADRFAKTLGGCNS